MGPYLGKVLLSDASYEKEVCASQLLHIGLYLLESAFATCKYLRQINIAESCTRVIEKQLCSITCENERFLKSMNLVINAFNNAFYKAGKNTDIKLTYNFH